MIELFPPIEPYKSYALQVSDLHSLYVEESGNPSGKPLVVLHGGPGGGSHPSYRRYFDPKIYRIIQFDQRGAGKSRPFAELRENTTWDLVADIEKIRLHTECAQWHVFGGSWGSTLALAYAQAHPLRVKALILRGIFLLRSIELDWFYEGRGAALMFPDEWQKFLEPIPVEERSCLIEAYHRRLTCDDRQVRMQAARAWTYWELRTSRIKFNPAELGDRLSDEFAEAFARIECHYFINKGFMRGDSQLLDDVPRIRHIPAVIVHGRYDVVCPAVNAWDLKSVWSEADLVYVEDAGHSIAEPGITQELLKASKRFESL